MSGTQPNSMTWGIYVHVPWCHRRCSYCDFYFEVGKPKPGFASLIHSELQARLTELPDGKASTLYLGGGTPSVLPPQELYALIQGFNPYLQPDAEITLELNPEDASLAYCYAIVEAGVNRVSIGAQSFDDGILKQLGRRHRQHHLHETLQHLKSAGIKRVSLDLIVGVPGENPDQIQQSIEWCIPYGVSQFSVYLLTLEDNTPLQRLIIQGKRPPINPDEQASRYEWIQHLLPSLGFMQYEISSYAKPGEASRHNRIYWSQGEYIGLGPGAHSMRLLTGGAVERRHNTANVAFWWPSPAEASHTLETLEPALALKEAMAFGLRDMGTGIDLHFLAQRHQTPLTDEQQSTFSKLLKQGFLQQVDGRYRLTSLGARFADAVARELL